MESSLARQIEVVRLPGLVPFQEAAALQQERQRAVEEGRAGNALFLLEHEPVITLGRSAHEENLLRSREELVGMGIGLEETGRGGDVTYHGPGQLVAYPILDLQLWRPSIRWYLRELEAVVMDLLRDYGLDGERQDGFTGVWVGGAKIAAIGVRIHRWVTSHGVSLNVDPIMAHFDTIVPCGLVGKPVTSLRALMGEAPPMSEVMECFEASFKARFSAE